MKDLKFTLQKIFVTRCSQHNLPLDVGWTRNKTWPKKFTEDALRIRKLLEAAELKERQESNISLFCLRAQRSYAPMISKIFSIYIRTVCLSVCLKPKFGRL